MSTSTLVSLLRQTQPGVSKSQPHREPSGALAQEAPVSQLLKLLMTWQPLLIQGPTLV